MTRPTQLEAYDGELVYVYWHEGEAYLLGNYGLGLVLTCMYCHEEHSRDPERYFRNPDWETCWDCKKKTGERRLMHPVKIAELEDWERRWAHISDSRMPRPEQFRRSVDDKSPTC